MSKSRQCKLDRPSILGNNNTAFLHSFTYTICTTKFVTFISKGSKRLFGDCTDVCESCIDEMYWQLVSVKGVATVLRVSHFG